jgi:hypothetical protein
VAPHLLPRAAVVLAPRAPRLGREVAPTDQPLVSLKDVGMSSGQWRRGGSLLNRVSGC